MKRVDDLYIHSVHRNANLDITSEENIPIRDYTEQISIGLYHIMEDVENVFYRFMQGRSKEDWPQTILNDFNAIKHKIFDKAGEIKRLPENLITDGENLWTWLSRVAK